MPRQDDSDGFIAIPSVYGALDTSPHPGVVVGIVLGSVAGFLLLLFLLYSCLGFGPRVMPISVVEGSVLEEVRTTRRSGGSRRHHSHSRHRRRRSTVRATETVEVRTRERVSVPPPPPGGGGGGPIIVDAPAPRMVHSSDEDDDEDEVVVIEEHTPPPRRPGRRSGSRVDEYYERRSRDY